MKAASCNSRPRVPSLLIRRARLSRGPLALGPPGAAGAVVVVLRPAKDRRAPGAGAARQDTLMEPHVLVVAGGELPGRVRVTGAGPPVLAGRVAVEEDEVAPVPVVELEGAVAEDVRMRGKLLDQLVVDGRERGAVDLAPLHAEESDPDEVPAVAEPPGVEDDRPVEAPARLLALDDERPRARRHAHAAPHLLLDLCQHPRGGGQIRGGRAGVRELA